MNFVHGLALAFILFEGVIIQCEAAGSDEERVEKASVVGINAYLPNDIIEVILYEAGLEATKNAARAQMNISRVVMTRIIEKRIVVIDPDDLFDGTQEYYQDGDYYLEIGSYDRIIEMFQKFGKKVKRIHVIYDELYGDDRRYLNDYVIKPYVNKLTELRIKTLDDTGLWQEILNPERQLHFPSVKKFDFYGTNTRDSFKLESIFPNLEIFKFYGAIVDTNCLENVKNLKELTLRTRSIAEQQFDHIFVNNKNLTKLALLMPYEMTTLRSIHIHLTKLKTLKLRDPGRGFLIRANDPVYTLASVDSLDVIFGRNSELVGPLSFNMPNVTKIRLHGNRIDSDISGFVSQFKNLKTLEVKVVHRYDVAQSIAQLKNIKEFITTKFEMNLLSQLYTFFHNFDEKTFKLRTIKFLRYKSDEFNSYETRMNQINIELWKIGKNTWNLTCGVEMDSLSEYLMFECN
ncbi:uncharacterized protein LOC116340432 [Contarinia nasturtii]|uniref:uncharacterized protein LOC116340432 n=1 Tax=Contarinia nasturtii TaxID=265458 RepID=UPI0012D43B3B|nr:uncharacterized protein LOC116340432 [Contarinia nasturtii]